MKTEFSPVDGRLRVTTTVHIDTDFNAIEFFLSTFADEVIPDLLPSDSICNGDYHTLRKKIKSTLGYYIYKAILQNPDVVSVTYEYANNAIYATTETRTGEHPGILLMNFPSDE